MEHPDFAETAADKLGGNYFIIPSSVHELLLLPDDGYMELQAIHANFSLKTGDILLTIVGSIGEIAILKESEGLTFQRSVAFLRPKEDILSEFLCAEIQTPTFQKELECRKSTSAQPGIYLGDLAELPVKYTISLDEQNKIGEYFLNLDNLITLHQRKPFLMKWRTSDANRNQTNRLVL